MSDPSVKGANLNDIPLSTKVLVSYYDTAKLDIHAAITLSKQERYPQTMFLLEQSFEKSLKTFYFYYMVAFEGKHDKLAYRDLRRFRHDNVRKLVGLAHNTNQVYRRMNTDWGAPIKDTLESHRTFLSDVEKLDYSYKEIVKDYPAVMNRMLHRYTIVSPDQVKVLDDLTALKSQFSSSEEKLFVDVAIKFYKSMLLVNQSIFLALAFKHIDKASRYPLKELDYSNIDSFSRPEMKSICQLLITAVQEHIRTTGEIMTPQSDSRR